MNWKVYLLKILVIMVLSISNTLELNAAVTHRTPAKQERAKTVLKPKFEKLKYHVKAKKQKKPQHIKRAKRTAFIGTWGGIGIYAALVIGMLVSGIVFGLTFLWILAVVLLVVPLAICLFFIIMLNNSGDWC